MNQTEFIHRWANNVKGFDNKSYKHLSIYTAEDIIYSYGRHFPMAWIDRDKDVVFITNKTYSTPTAKHLGYVRQATTQYQQIVVRDVTNKPIKEWALNEIDLMFKAMQDIQNKRQRQRTNFTHRVNQLTCAYNNIINLTEYMGLDEDKRLEEVKTWLVLTEQEQTKEVEHERKAREKRAKLHAERQKEYEERARLNQLKEAERIQEFLNGNKHITYLNTTHTYLRVKGDEIQTSRGASISIECAKDLWAKIKNNEDVTGMQLGHYRVTSFDGKSLRVGCHTICIKELIRMSEVLNIN